MELNVRAAEINVIDTMDYECEFWFELEGNYQDMFIMKFDNLHGKPEKILKYIEEGDEEISIIRCKAMERRKDEIFNQLIRITNFYGNDEKEIN